MIYYGDTTIPKNTPISSPYEYVIDISKGTVKRIEIYFPWGCAGLVGVQIHRYTWQIFPNSREKWITGNDKIWFEEPYEVIDTEPYTLTVKTYNLDDTFDHTPLIAIEIIKTRETQFINQFLKALGM